MVISLRIKSDYLKKYLEYIFEKKDGIFIIRRTEEFGKLLCSFFKKSDYPINMKKSEQTVRLMLPKQAHLKSESEKYYLYFSESDTNKLNDYLKTIFELDFKQYYLAGRAQKLLQKDIIDAFIVSRKLVNENLDVTDMLKKRIYRAEEQNLAILRRKFLRKSKEINKKIE